MNRSSGQGHGRHQQKLRLGSCNLVDQIQQVPAAAPRSSPPSQRGPLSHTLCIRYGRRSFHLQKSTCSSCGYPAARIRKSKLRSMFLMCNERSTVGWAMDGTSIGDEQDGANKPRRRSSICSSSCSWRNKSESLLLLCCPGVTIHSSRGVAEPLLRLQPPSGELLPVPSSLM
ncbi:uncharacterized protein [Aegilops tauschii subsp. strangulata]|uniref:uncharacterized protein n=1 Tax=Aegilops tauschii subsp. strangulata TaxID=200361 RepID=UPI003CC847AE